MTNHITSPWTDVLVAELTRLHASGLSAHQIGMQLGRSRNAVCGKLHRMGLSEVLKGLPPRPPRERKPRVKRSTVTHQYTLSKLMRGGNNRIASVTKLLVVETSEFKLRCVEVAPLNLTLADLPANGCHYIAGDDLLYCGHPVKDGSSYCVPHHFLCWAPPRVLTDKAPAREAA